MHKRIDQIATLIPGINQSRADRLDENNTYQYYTQADFDHDFKHMYLHSNKNINNNTNNSFNITEGDVVISSSMQLATIVGKSDFARVLSINFIKVDLNDDINKEYFVYLYNLNKEIKRQKERETQGMGLIQRITLRSMGLLEIPIVSKEKQDKIGSAYIEMLRFQDKLKQYGILIEKMTYSVLEENLEE